jgi:hypothetical protein
MEWQVNNSQVDPTTDFSSISLNNNKAVTALLEGFASENENQATIEFIDASTCQINANGKLFCFKLSNIPVTDAYSIRIGNALTRLGHVSSKLTAAQFPSSSSSSPNRNDTMASKPMQATESTYKGVTVLPVNEAPNPSFPVQSNKPRKRTSETTETMTDRKKQKASVKLAQLSAKYKSNWVVMRDLSPQITFKHINKFFSGISIVAVFGTFSDHSLCSFYVEFQNNIGTELAMLRNREVHIINIGHSSSDFVVELDEVESSLECFWAKTIGFRLTEDNPSVEKADLLMQKVLPQCTGMLQCKVHDLAEDQSKLYPNAELSAEMIDQIINRDDQSKLLNISARCLTIRSTYCRDVIGQNNSFDIEMKYASLHGSDNYRGLHPEDASANDAAGVLKSPLKTLVMLQVLSVDLSLREPEVGVTATEEISYAQDMLRRLISGFRLLVHILQL